MTRKQEHNQHQIKLCANLAPDEKNLLEEAISKLRPANAKHFGQLVGIKEDRVRYFLRVGGLKFTEVQAINKAMRGKRAKRASQ